MVKILNNNSVEAVKLRALELVRGMTLMDDEYFRAVANGNTSFFQFVLDLILEGRRKETVSSAHTQHEVSIVNRKKVIYDAYIETESGTKVVIEVQKKPKDFSAQRLRYYLSLLDAVSLNPGDPYDALPDEIFILIMPMDVFGRGEAVYFVPEDLVVEGNIVKDGRLLVFIDSRRMDEDTEIGRLMHDFNSPDPEKMYYNEIRQMVSGFRESEGEKQMTDAIERELEIMKAEGEARGEAKTMKRNILSMIRNSSFSDSEISRYLDVPVSEVTSLRLTTV